MITFADRRGLQVALLTFAMVFVSGCGINTIPTLDEAVKAAWGQVENQYQRRADLVPNLVNTVKGYAAHESETFREVTEARAQVGKIQISSDIVNNPAMLQQFEKAQGALTSALSRLMVVAERYPDLKANQNFLNLQAQLEGTENRIAVARRDFIQSVQKFNTEVRTFPGLIWHKIMYSELKVKESFQASPGAEQAPKVEF